MNPFDKLWKFIQDRDGKHKNAKDTLPLFHQSISLASFDIPEYHIWEAGEIPQQLSNIIHAEYRLYINGNVGNTAITFNQTPQYNGLHINCRLLKYNNVDYKYFLVHLTKKIMAQQYKKSLGEVKSERKNNNISTFFIFYLKPNLMRMEPTENGKMPQFYGNILMKYETVNEEPHQLTITVNKYSDHKYDKAIPFSEFIKTVFPKN